MFDFVVYYQIIIFGRKYLVYKKIINKNKMNYIKNFLIIYFKKIINILLYFQTLKLFWTT